MIALSEVPSSAFDRYVSKITLPRLEKKVKTIESLQCISQSCKNRVICRCTICLENLCYEHSQHHRHAMTNFEVLKQ